MVSTIAGGGGGGGGGTKDGLGTFALFYYPYDIAVHPFSGNIFVADYGNFAIRLVTFPTYYVSTIAGGSEYGEYGGFKDGIGTFARFNLLYGITLDKYGNIFVTDWGNHAVRMITNSTYSVSTIAGGNGYGLVNGIGTNAKFSNSIGGITSDLNGNLYVADLLNRNIRKLTPLIPTSSPTIVSS
jgi:DNA-binding beta-propeller fold protein YncE